MVQMVAQGYQQDWLQTWTKIKSLKFLYVMGRDANVSRAAKILNPFCDELSEILDRDYAVAYYHMVQCTTLG